MLFNIAMTVLFGIQFGRIGWQSFFMNFRMLCQVGLCHPAEMGPGSVPDQNEGARQMLLEMLQSFQNLFAVDGSLEMPFVDLAREREGHGGRQHPPIRCNLMQDRPPSPASPGGRRRFLKGEPKFIPEHDFGAQPPRLFLSSVNRGPATPGSVRVPVRQPAPAAFVRCSPTGVTGD